MKNTLFIIDAYNLIYRMFYAIPEMTTRSGKPVNAVFGVAKFLKALAEENPDALMLVATDVGQSFRAEIFAEYKWTRDRMPDNLRSQIEDIFSLFEKANIKILAKEGYEADDIIGSIAHQHENNSYQVVIISSDKDLCQFVRDGHVHIYDAMKRKFLKEKDVLEKFGVPAHQVRDYLAIVGDASDNIPWINGFGPKKAVELLQKYQTLEWIYDHQDELSLKMKEVLIKEKENAFLSQRLASIITDLEQIPLPEKTFSPGLQNPEYRDFLITNEFKSLVPTSSETQKTFQTPEPTLLDTFEKLTDFEKMIFASSWEIVLSTDAFGKVVFGISDQIFVLGTRKIDALDFLDRLLQSDKTFIGFDIKADMKRILDIKQKPLQNASEGQGRLF